MVARLVNREDVEALDRMLRSLEVDPPISPVDASPASGGLPGDTIP